MIDPTSLTPEQIVLHQYATAALQRGELGKAMEAASRLLAAAPDAPDALHLLGLVHSLRGEHSEALRRIDAAVGLAPSQPTLLANRAVLLRRAGRTGEVKEAFRHAAEADPNNADLWRQSGDAALSAGDIETSTRHLRRAIKLAPDDAANWRSLGLALRDARRWKLSAAAFLRSLAIEKNHATTWMNLGVVFRMLGRSDRALECLERARQDGLASGELENTIVGVLVDLGRVEEALARSKQLTAAYSAWPEAHRTRALLKWEYDSADNNDPFSEYREHLTSRPGDRTLRWDYARLLLEARRADEALPVLMDLLPSEPGPMIRILVGTAHESLGDSATAQAWFEKALALFGNSVPTSVLNIWSRHLIKSGRWQEAEESAGRACAQSPLDQESWAYRATIWRLLGDPRTDWLCDTERLVGFMPVEWPDAVDPAVQLAALKAAVEPMHLACRHPVHQSVRGGSQTSGRLFGRAEPAITEAASALRATVKRWVETLPDDATHPFLSRRQGAPEFTGSWSIKLWRAGRHANHMHSEGWLSSAFYLALPRSVINGTQGEAGCLQFGVPPDELGLSLSPLRVLRPREGWVAMFPSYLWHGTVPFDDPEPRITAAFDLVMLPAD